MFRVLLIGWAIGQSVLCMLEHHHRDAIMALLVTAVLALEWKVTAQGNRLRDAGL